jgi:hypothetical protein
MKITYEAKMDLSGALVPIKALRKALVLRFADGEFVYVCGAFYTLDAAKKRAAKLNAAAT